jgi:hypothetical protein
MTVARLVAGRHEPSACLDLDWCSPSSNAV